MRFQKNFRVKLRDLKIFNDIDKGIKKTGSLFDTLVFRFSFVYNFRRNLRERQQL